jgi:hypothetical protein
MPSGKTITAVILLVSPDGRQQISGINRLVWTASAYRTLERIAEFLELDSVGRGGAA